MKFVALQVGLTALQVCWLLVHCVCVVNCSCNAAINAVLAAGAVLLTHSTRPIHPDLPAMGASCALTSCGRAMQSRASHAMNSRMKPRMHSTVKIHASDHELFGQVAFILELCLLVAPRPVLLRGGSGGLFKPILFHT